MHFVGCLSPALCELSAVGTFFFFYQLVESSVLMTVTVTTDQQLLCLVLG